MRGATQKKKISNETIVAAYPTILAVARKELHRPTGIRKLVIDFDMNANSARDFVDNFGKMVKGEEYQRLNTIFQTEFYLKMIERDFGPENLRRAISAVEQHLTYYERASGNKQPGVRRVLNTEYRHLRSHQQKDRQKAVAREARCLKEQGEFDPDNLQDARRWVLASIARRQGRPEFRQTLLRLYRGRCAISGTRVAEVLEAAHISGYKGPKTNHPANGLLLRSDLHTLFDLQLITVDTETMTVIVSPLLKRSSYDKFTGKNLELPQDKASRPSKKALNSHRARSGL